MKGSKLTGGGDETPPISEEDLEQQKIEHERQMQKEKVSQAREAEEVRMLDIELLHQRAIGAEEEQIKRESDLRKASLTLLKLQSSTSISDNEEISIPLLGPCKEKSMESVVSRETPCFTTGKDLRAWRMSANDVRSRASLIRVSSYPM
ncbi:unnamed protein product [Colias eurytheme]|nr:unnamed protein product [Colias eurytheme]